MGRVTSRLRIVTGALLVCFCSGLALGQNLGASVVQVFMPGGGAPPNVLRLTLVRDNGFMDTFFTDSKGKFEMPTPTSGTVNYIVTIESDRQHYDTTTANLTLQGLQPTYLTIFLKPLPPEKVLYVRRSA